MPLWYSLIIGLIQLHISSSVFVCPVKICAQTTSALFAGTDEDVYVKLFSGSGRETPWIYLDYPNFDDFERGSLNCYEVESLRQYVDTREVQIDKVGVRVNGERRAESGWDLEYIAVLDDCDCRQFNYNMEFDAFDKPVYREHDANCIRSELDNPSG